MSRVILIGWGGNRWLTLLDFTMTNIRTSKADKNWLSLNSDSVVWFAGTPDEKQGELIYPLDLKPSLQNTFTTTSWDAILKLSGRTDTQLAGLEVAQGKENSVDINSVSHSIALEGRFGINGGVGDQVFTIKGGTYDVAIKGSVESTGRIAHCTIGNWSDQSTATTHHLDLSLLRVTSGEPFTVVFGRVNSPILTILGKSPDIALPPNVRILVWKSLGLLGYWWVKRIYVLIRYHRW